MVYYLALLTSTILLFLISISLHYVSSNEASRAISERETQYSIIDRMTGYSIFW